MKTGHRPHIGYVAFVLSFRAGCAARLRLPERVAVFIGLAVSDWQPGDPVSRDDYNSGDGPWFGRFQVGGVNPRRDLPDTGRLLRMFPSIRGGPIIVLSPRQHILVLVWSPGFRLGYPISHWSGIKSHWGRPMGSLRVAVAEE